MLWGCGRGFVAISCMRVHTLKCYVIVGTECTKMVENFNRKRDVDET